MKFIVAFAHIASFAVLAEGQDSGASLEYKRPESVGYKRPETVNYSRPTTATFTNEGVNNVLDVATKKPSADSDKAIKSVKAFLDRNPAIVKSIEKVANDPKHKKAKDDIVSKAISAYTQSYGNLDLHAIGIKAINYAYEKPEVLKLVQEAGVQVFKDSPNLVDNFFDSFDKMAKEDPSVVHNVKQSVIDFSKDNEDAYQKVYEMALKSALLDIKTSSHAAIRGLQVDQIACSGSKSSDCSCENKNYEEKTAESEGEGEVEAEKPEVSEEKSY